MNTLDLPTNPILPADPLGAAAPLRRMIQASADATKAEKVAKDFEAILLHRLMEEMRRTIPKSGLLQTGISRQIDGLFWFYLAEEIAQKGGIGLWKNLAGRTGVAGQTAPVKPVSGPNA